MSYLVLARKYRPQSFDDLVGQAHVARTLANAIAQNRVAHAFLFTGVRGVGKTTSARLLAKCLNCLGADGKATGPTATPCQVCAACKEIAAGSDVDVQEIDGASYNGVDEVRRLQEGIAFRPARDRFKIYIVDEVHMLSNAAWNAFLKTLEEPPPHVKFIFATTEVHKVPVTILSRCQRYDFKLIATQVIGLRLREVLALEKIEADDAAVAILAREAAGSMRDAMSLLDQVIAYAGEKLSAEDVARVLGVADRAILHELASALVAGDAAAALKVVDRVAQQGFDLPHVSKDILAHLRNVVVAKVCGEGADRELLDLADEEVADVRALAAKADVDDLQRLFQGFSRSFDEIVRSGQPRTALEMALVRLARRPPLLPLDELLSRLGDLERRLAMGAPPPGGTGTGPGGRGGGGEAARPRTTSMPTSIETTRQGSSIETTRQGSSIETTRQGSSIETTRQGSSIETTRQGSSIETTRQGSSIETTRQGSSIETTRQGSSIETTRQGSSIETTRQGSSIETTRQGSSIETTRQGSSIETTRQGSSIETTRQGSSIETTRQGSSIETTRQGSSIETTRQGSSSTSGADRAGSLASPLPPALPQSLPVPPPTAPWDSGGREHARASVPSGDRTRGSLALAEPQAAPAPAPPPPVVPAPVPAAKPVPAAEAPSPRLERPANLDDWRAILSRVRSAKAHVAAIFEHGVPLEVTAQRVLLGYQTGSFEGAQASEPEAMDLLQREARAHFGTDTKVALDLSARAGTTVAALDAAQRKAELAKAHATAEAHPLVQKAIALFGAELKDIRLPEGD